MFDVYGSSGYRYQTNRGPDGSYALSTFQNGRMVSQIARDAAGAQLTSSTFGYDGHGREHTLSDARNWTVTRTFNNADLVTTATTPVPGSGQAAQVTTTAFDSSLRAWKVTQPDGASVTNEFYPTGLLRKQSGARTYPVEYEYDPAGRLKTMTTWQSFASSGGAATTTWNYDGNRGWLENKRYQDGTGPDYSYYLNGHLKERAWARGAPRLKTTFGYTAAGDLETVDYSDATPDLNYSYDRFGRQTGVTQGTNVTGRFYSLGGALIAESYTAGILSGLAVTNRLDSWQRRTNLALVSGGTTVVVSSDYSYGPASRLQRVASGTQSASYSYLANSPLVSQIAFTNSGAHRMTISKSYDFLNRLTAIQALNSQPSTLNSFSYTYNPANQRTLRREGDESYWRYEYDSLGQVRSGKKYWSDGTLVAGQQFEYSFDDIGNRTQAKAGGDENGANLRTNVYSANLVNQYTNRTVPGLVEVMGLALGTNTVTVDGQAPYRRGEYFRKEVAVTNTSAPVWRSVVVASPGETSVTRHEFVPRTPENFGYDLDGNLTNDGRWVYTWDAENRLARMVSATTVGPQQRLDFVYDWQGRRIAKTVWDNTAGTGSPATDLKFLYDGWNLIAELNATNNATIRSYGWGLDLSGSMQGAGGVGGLLSVTVHAGPEAGSYFCAYDGNGNVISLINATNGTIAAQYEYGPFGELLRATGPMAGANPFRFSSKYQDDESELIYYGYRYYTASTGRWLSRDPIQEQGGNNLYGFAVNSPVTAIDADGRLSFVAIAVGAAVITIAADVVITAWLNSMERSRNTGHVKLDISGNTITVKPCQIVVFIGHGTQGRGWRFNVPNPEQSGAAFVGCNPQGVNGTIPKQALLAGAPMHNEDMGSIPSAIVKKYKDKNFSYSAITAFHISQDLIDRIVDQPLEYHMEAVVPAVEKAARARARSICSAKPCPCRSVEIIVYNYDAPLGELPSTYKLTYSCGKSAQ